MTWLQILGLCAWFVCGAAAVAIDMRDHPEPVARGADELLRAVTFMMGPLGLAILLFVKADMERW